MFVTCSRQTVNSSAPLITCRQRLITSAGVSHNSVSQTLASVAAFGAEPGYWPLPTASNPTQRWLRAVAAGGQGYYGCAHSELAALRREVTRRAVGFAGAQHSGITAAPARLARVGQGLGRSRGAGPLRRPEAMSRRASTHWSVWPPTRSGWADSPRRRRCSTARVPRCPAGAHATPPARLAIRVQWVSAELAMATGDGATALRHAAAFGRTRGCRRRLHPAPRQEQRRAGGRTVLLVASGGGQGGGRQRARRHRGATGWSRCAGRWPAC